ncbi:MAG: hypothetical protein H0T42_27595 [Deltaproteobacteria bacterium]|nr:hypothetical protein [Deltaproteobacteria bacterium]
MATPVEPVIESRTVNPEPELVITTGERSIIASPIGWSTIFAAAVVAGAVWLVLHMFGVGVGLTAIEPDDPSSLRAVGIGTGIWSLIAPVIALFIGGLVAGRVAPTINTLNAVIHGAVVWGLTVLASILMIVMVVSAMLRGAVKVVSTTADVAGASAGQLGKLPSAVGLDSKDLVAPINQRLQREGMPPVTSDQLEAVVKEVVETSVRTGDINRTTMVEIVARRTALSRPDADKVATAIESEISGAATRGRELAGQAGETAMQAAETTGKLVLSLSLMMILTLGAAILGSILAVRRERREHVVLPRASTR